jgi:segregation and condensation protein A
MEEGTAREFDQNGESDDSSSQYKVKLEIFEGPLDLLLYLIKKEEVSIYDIPIARITEQYLNYIRAMQGLDIAVAGEFLVMAATLIHIKSQMLLPRDPDAPEGDLEDPRQELVYQLLEHQKFKAAANVLHQRATIQSATFSRGSLDTDKNNPEIASTVFQLFEIFKEVMERKRAITEIEIAREEITMAEKLSEIKSLLSVHGEVPARSLFERARSRREAVIIFLAVLEMVKEQLMRLAQSDTFGEIMLLKREDFPPEAIMPEDTQATTPAEAASEEMPLPEQSTSNEQIDKSETSQSDEETDPAVE